MKNRFVALLFGLLLGAHVAFTAHAYSFDITTSPDGVKYSEHWLGDFVPSAPACAAPFTGCAIYGTGTIQNASPSSTAQQLTRESGDGWATAYISFSDETNVAIKSCPTFVAGTSALWGAAGVAIVEGGSTFASDYKAVMALPPSASTTLAYTNYASAAVTGIANTGTPCIGLKHVAATNVTTLWDSNDGGTTWYLRGTLTRDFGAGRIMVYAHPNASAATATFLHSNIVTNYATLAALFVDAGTPPVDDYEALPSTFTNRTGGPPWISGVGQLSAGQWSALEAWQAYPPDMGVVWTGNNPNWAQIITPVFAQTNGVTDSDPSFLNAALSRLPVTTPIEIMYALLGRENGTKNCANLNNWNIAADADGAGPGTAGAFDANWVSAANALKTKLQNAGRDPKNTVIRLGHEHNNTWSNWSVCDRVAEFKIYWTKIYDIFQTIIPGILFDYSIDRQYLGYSTAATKGSGTCNLACMAPPARTYNVISRSHHDGLPQTTSDASWLNSQMNSAASGNNRLGWTEIEAYAATVHKRLAITEWHMQYDACWGEGISANPNLFLTKTNQLIRRWVAEGKFAWELYLTFSCSAFHYRASTVSPASSGQIPAATYKSLWVTP